MTVPCEYDVSKLPAATASSGMCLHREITIVGSRVTCQDCIRMFIGWVNAVNVF